MSSCTKDEKKLASLFESIKTSRIKLIENNSFPDLINETLILLKSYSDSLNNGSDLLDKLMDKSSSKKKIRKYLIKTEGLTLVCSNFFLDDKALDIMRDQCQLGFFDICPISFSKYEQNKKKMIENLLDILGNNFNKTDCQDYISEKLENE